MPKRTNPNLIIIDGHGETDRSKNATFDFKRPNATKCCLYSYTRESIPIGVDASNRIIQAAISTPTDIPSIPTEIVKSRIGGSIVRDRILHPQSYKVDVKKSKTKYEWNYALPISWSADVIELEDKVMGGTTECVVHYSNKFGPKQSDFVWMTIVADESGGPTTGRVKLSTIIEYFDTRPYDIMWMACRSG